jgi:hypothetical protein
VNFKKSNKLTRVFSPQTNYGFKLFLNTYWMHRVQIGTFSEQYYDEIAVSSMQQPVYWIKWLLLVKERFLRKLLQISTKRASVDMNVTWFFLKGAENEVIYQFIYTHNKL